MEPQSSDSSSKSSSPDPAGGGLAPLPAGTRGKKNRLPGMSPQMATFSLQQRPRVKRVSAPKVRTGCITCKRRRVKCDETRPFCLKCTKSPRGSGVCEGYPPDRASKPANRPLHAAPRTIVARGTWRLQEILVEPGYDCAFFTGPEERGYFDFWRILVNNIYLFPSDVMARILPQLARHEPAIKHAALAMAAMARALVPNLKRRTRKELQSNGPHYEFALKHYVRAIKLVRTSVPSSENMLWAIVCCVLFVTFECLHGDRYAALSHVNHAYKMMEDYFSRRSLVGATPETESIRSVCDDAAWIFQGMTMQFWSHNKLHPREENEINWCCRGSKRPFAVDEMPMTFDSLHSGRRWWRVVQHYICHRCPIYKNMYAEGSATAQEVRFGSWSRSAYDSEDAENWRAVLPEFLGHLQRWSNGFQAVYSKLRKSRKWDFHSYVEACNLRVQYLLLWTDVFSTSYSEVEAVAGLTPEFREIVQLSRDVLETQANCGGCADVFSMDNGPTMPLLVVACNCREPNVRQEATDLLGKHPRRDGLWDSRTFHTIAMKNVELEAENVDVGDGQGDGWSGSGLARRETSLNTAENIQAKLINWQPEVAEWRAVDEHLEELALEMLPNFGNLPQQQQPIHPRPGRF